MQKTYANIKVEDSKNSILTIEGVITLEAIAFEQKEELKRIRKEFKLPGFRPGHVPEEILKQHVSEDGIFSEAAQTALHKAYPEIVAEFNIHPLSYPRIEIRKIALGNPMEFKIEVGVVPEFKLPDYKKIARGIPLSPEEAKDEDVMKIMQEIEEARSTETEKFSITDETIGQVGKFENVEDFKTKLKMHLQEEKNESAKAKRREEIGRILIEKTRLDLPKFWEEDARHETLHEIEHAAEDNGTTKEEIVKKFGKTEDELLKAEIDYREKQEKIRIILEKIAEEEKIEIPADELERETMNLQAHYRDAEYERLKKITRETLLRQKALELLENIK